MTPEDRGVLAYMIERIGKAVDQRTFIDVLTGFSAFPDSFAVLSCLFRLQDADLVEIDDLGGVGLAARPLPAARQLLGEMQ